jgi:cytoplasmic iron level regulating protein YaaA (DUF328/UPF0246 family)
MDVIIIACSGTKSIGGVNNYQSSSLPNHLSSESTKQLMNSRKEIVNYLQLPYGPDIYENKSICEVLYMPAYLRYSGKVYTRSNLPSFVPLLKNAVIVIVSAFYGFVEVQDFIRNYELKMSDLLPTSQSVGSFWKNKNLGSILKEYILRQKPTNIFDLLPITYRKVIGDWSQVDFKETQNKYIKFTYPGERTGSLWSRGKDLEALLLRYSQ